MERFRKFKIEVTGVSTDDMDDLKGLVKENNLTFPVLSDSDFVATKAYRVPVHENDDLYADYGRHNEPAYFLVDEKGRILHLHTLTGAFGRPSPEELMKTVKQIISQMKQTR